MEKAQVEKRISLRNILFLTDFSWASQSALLFVREIAEEYGARVTALHVTIPEAFRFKSADRSAAAIELQQESETAEMRQVALQLNGIPNQTRVIAGQSVWAAVETVLQNGEIDLVVVGTHGHTGLPKVLLGSTAEEIFRHSPVPVLTLGPAACKLVTRVARWKRVLYATDFSQQSLGAAPYAVSFAEEHDAQLALVHVIEALAERKEAQQIDSKVAECLQQLFAVVPEQARLWCRPEVRCNSIFLQQFR